tara:strand:+ start:1502 stop:1738 length:237 start_codon:yes stop_codon:yes gene_type:complete
MKFYEITDDVRVYPGEYLLYTPRMEIVLCGAYMPSKNKIKVMARGQMIEDRIENFQKIRLTSDEKKKQASSKCKGCGD